jgi:ParB/RepB/Spo0J family partition protein
MDEFVTRKMSDLSPGSVVGFNNPREKFDWAELKQLAADIDARGLMYPLQIWEAKTPEGENVSIVVDGERRKRAIEILLEEDPKHVLSKGIPCRTIRAETLTDAKYAAIAGNVQRNELSSYELAQDISRLKELGETQKAVALGLHKSESWVSRKLSAFENACDALKGAWKRGVVPDDTIEDLASLDVEEQEAALTEVLRSRKQGRAGKSAARKKTKKRAARVQRPSSKELRELILYVDHDKKSAKESAYVMGVYDALRVSTGTLDPTDLGSEWKQFQKAIDKKIASEADDAEEKAEAAKAKKLKAA